MFWYKQLKCCLAHGTFLYANILPLFGPCFIGILATYLMYFTYNTHSDVNALSVTLALTVMSHTKVYKCCIDQLHDISGYKCCIDQLHDISGRLHSCILHYIVWYPWLPSVDGTSCVCNTILFVAIVKPDDCGYSNQPLGYSVLLYLVLYVWLHLLNMA